MDRKQKAIIALHDFGSRDGATAASVKRAMLDEGFTLSEIAEASEAMLLAALTPTAGPTPPT